MSLPILNPPRKDDLKRTYRLELWFSEIHHEHHGITIRIEKTLFSGQSPYQRVDVFETVPFGRMLTLDGVVMTTELDEFIYHEMLVHVPLFTHPRAQDLLIIGGGDGGSVREARKYASLRHIHLVEIDEMVLRASREHLPTLSRDLDGPTVQITIQDGVEFVKGKDPSYDVVLIDSSDPYGPGVGLFEESFYQDVFSLLREDGLMVAQSESAMADLNLVKSTYRRLRATFPIVRVYLATIPTYPLSLWSFTLASKRWDPLRDFSTERVRDSGIQTRYYNAEIHRGAFALPNFVREGLEA